ncbi:probable JmjC domain-containing histone demethylation protein 2C isoform X7 [Suricata suricatta]|uniref:probable JmjC domain-containing histone demethylation protein 2C isoform X7 n=1 Tax=Suricata suricatta TaxID=37032 RepID=UPI001155BBDA|nr:probable JmjC domain-containing histone demethylation protein 2C isoform X7 [Suricata suricatta]
MAMAVETRLELVGKRFLCVAVGEEARPERGESERCWRGWRAGVIRAVSHRDSRNPDLAVYVEFDDLEWDKREWVKVYEDFSTFLVEYHLIWARRIDPSQTQGSKSKQIQWPALTFKPLVEKSIPSSITAVEFLVDKQLDFLTEDSAFQPYQDDIDSLNPVLRDNPQLQEEVKVWVKEQKVQEIFMQGPYSLNGYRVRVYRQDSATQWFTGIITHHDLFTRTMIVMNDQVLEPQNVDPSMVQMTFLDDVVHSLLKGENIGITSRRRSRASQNSNAVHGHYTRAQANSPRPAMNSQAAVPKQNTHQQQQQRNTRPSKRKGSDSSIPDEEKMKEEKCDYIARGENAKGKNKQLMNKRRKPEEDEKKLNMKRLRTDNVSDFSESSDSENSSKRTINNSSEQKPENELKNKNTSKVNGEEGKSQNNEKVGEETLIIDSQPPWDQIQEDKKHEEAEKQKSVDTQLQDKMITHSSEQGTLSDHNPNNLLLQECNMEKTHTVELLPKEKFASRPPTPKCVIDITNDTNSEKVGQETSSTFGLQTLQKMDPNVSDSKHSIANAKYLETAKQDSNQSWVSDVVKVDLTQSNVRSASSGNDHLNMEKEKNQYVSYMSSLSAVSVTEDKLHKRSPPPETVKSKLNTSVDAHKTKSNPSPEVLKPKITHSPDSVKSKANYVNSHAAGERRLANKIEHELSRCSFHSVPTRGSTLEATKSPLIIDKNEHFTVYRDPALVGSETGANHISPFLNQHPFPLHSSSHRTCLNPGTHHPALTPAPHLLAGSSSQTPIPTINTHPLTSGPHHSVHHPHLLPTVLPGVPTASLLGGHPRLETAHASSLSHLALAHQQQQQLLQHQSPHLLGQAHPSASYNQLGLYPIIWQYPNGTHAYSGLGLPSSKWVHPENAVNAESSLRRNSPSPWLHQPTPVTSADGIGLLSHIPVRPSSAEPHRSLKITAHSSPPLTKSLIDHHKEELERKAFIEPLRSVASTSAKNDLDLNRSQPGKDGLLHRHFVDPVLNQLQRQPQETGERLHKYKEEHRRILQESIDVAPFTTKIKGLEAGIPRSVLKDWRKVKKLKQTGESFLQDDSCCEIGPNLQKCRECRLIRSKKGEEPTHSPVFCRFYYFRRLSFSKNGVVRIDGFSSPDQYDDEAMSLWTHENYEDDELDIETSKYILDIIGDKFCQLVTSEKTALSWVKKDAKIAWKRAVRGVREMCDACEATLFNIHWVCQKCGFVVCLDCYKAKERKSSRDKELYAWMKCVKGQPHDHKHLMPTQIIPGSVLTDLLDVMHTLREKYGIKSHCHCTNKQNIQVGNFPSMNGVSQVLQNVLNHSNKISLCMPESQQQNNPQKSESNGNSSPGSDISTDGKLTPPESQSPLHWLADLAEQKSREEKKENKEFALENQIKEEREHDNPDSPNNRTSPPVSQNNEQGSTLRDLLTTTAGKLRVGSTDAGIAFAPVYSMGTPSGKSGRTMPNILDDIIASVVENKIPPNKASKINVKPELKEEPKERGKSPTEENSTLYSDVPHSWICEKHILWLQDYKNVNNWKLFRECWKNGQPAVVSGVHKKMNISLWKAESISLDFGDHQADLLNCKDSIISNANVKEFWDGFEEVSKRQKMKSGETVVLKLKDCPSGEDFKTMMPARYEDLLKSLPLPEYCNPEGKFNLASHLPGFFVRPDLGPRLCSAYGVAAAKDHDIGTTNLHVEVSDVVNILVYVGIAKGNGILSKAGVLKKFEEEDLDDVLRKRLKDSSEIPGALWHIYAGKDIDKIREFLQKISKEQGLEVLPEHDPIRDQSWYVNRKLRQRLLEEYGVRTCTLVQFLGDAVVVPAGALHQVQNFHSCIQVTEDFVSPEHLLQSFHLTQELRLLKEEINYDDKLQVKNILYHAVKEVVRALKIHEDEVEDMEEN